MDRRPYGATDYCAHSNSRPGQAPTDRASEETEAVLLALGQAIELRDRGTGGHCERLAYHSLALGMAMGLGRQDLQALYRGGFLHDIGKVGMPDTILFKPTALDADEWHTMRQHPLIGVEICRRLGTLEPVLPIIRSHHEKWDGSGYPDGLRGSGIPLLARVLQFADIYDALATIRPYKQAYPPKQALAIMQDETARGWRDPDLMQLFLRLHRNILSGPDRHAVRRGELSSMEESLLELEHRLARDAGPAPKPVRRTGTPPPSRVAAAARARAVLPQ